MILDKRVQKEQERQELMRKYLLMCKYNPSYFTAMELKTAKTYFGEEYMKSTSALTKLRNEVERISLPENENDPMNFPVEYVSTSESRRCLLRSDIKTVGQLIRLSPFGVLRIRGMGKVKLDLLRGNIKRFMSHFTGVKMAEGEWDNEPSYLEWEEGCYHMLILRSWVTGALCGYVGIPEKHPWYGESYVGLKNVQCHGGLTYSGNKIEGARKGCWYLGFDCSHAGDLMPTFADRLSYMRTSCTYRNVEYVREQVEELKEQIRVVWGFM